MATVHMGVPFFFELLRSRMPNFPADLAFSTSATAPVPEPVTATSARQLEIPNTELEIPSNDGSPGTLNSKLQTPPNDGPPVSRLSTSNSQLPHAPRSGRPGRLTPAVANAMYDAILHYGVTDSRAGAMAAVGASSVSRWKREEPSFADFLQEARASFEKRRIKKVRRVRRRDGRPIPQIAKWLLQRQDPERWGRPSRPPAVVRRALQSLKTLPREPRPAAAIENAQQSKNEQFLAESHAADGTATQTPCAPKIRAVPHMREKHEGAATALRFGILNPDLFAQAVFGRIRQPESAQIENGQQSKNEQLLAKSHAARGLAEPTSILGFQSRYSSHESAAAALQPETLNSKPETAEKSWGKNEVPPETFLQPLSSLISRSTEPLPVAVSFTQIWPPQSVQIENGQQSKNEQFLAKIHAARAPSTFDLKARNSNYETAPRYNPKP